jgi:hypothetical protein
MVGNMAPERVAAVFQQKDRDKDGKLTMQELLAAPSDDTARSTEKKDGKKSAGQDGSKKTK